MSDRCPSDDDLLSLAADEGDPSAEAGADRVRMQQHLDRCESCQQRIEQLNREMMALRRLPAEFLNPQTRQTPAMRAAQAGPPQLVFPGAMLADEPPEPPHDPGFWIGAYRVLEQLPACERADVFRAAHPTLGMDVIVRWMRQTLPTGTRRAQLCARGRALAGAGHRRLLRVFDFGLAEGRPFLVTEPILGTRLADLNRDRWLEPTKAAALVASLARAVAALNERGVMLGVLLPEGVVVDAGGKPQLVDFDGLAWLPDEQPHAAALESAAPYLAPELTGIRREAADARTEVFALGALLYYLLTRRPPFAARTVAESAARAAQGRYEAEPLAQPDIPPAVAAICRRALSQRPSDRQASAAELAAELDGRTAPAPAARGNWLKLAVALGGAALLFVLGWVISQWW